MQLKNLKEAKQTHSKQSTKTWGWVKKRTVRLLDAEEVVAWSCGEIATGESVFGGFLEEVFDVLGAYVSSPCFFTLS